MKNNRIAFLFGLLIIGISLSIMSCDKDDDDDNNNNNNDSRPTAIFTVSPTSGTKTTIFEFDASGCSDNEDSTDSLVVRWDWENDGVWDKDYTILKKAFYRYSSDGTYTVKLEVKDLDGMTDTATKTLIISSTPPIASFNIYPSSTGTTSSTFTFNASSSSDNEDPSSALQVRWDFENDGTWDIDYSTTKITSHKYSSSGTKTINLEVKDSEGMTGSTTKTVTIIPSNPTGTFVDSRDSKTYNWVTIGNQTWMAENLAWLPSVSSKASFSYDDPHYYVYDYNGTDVTAAKAKTNYKTYGVLYNWTAVMNGDNSSSSNPSGVQGACPSGWHLPSDAEWKELEMYLGMSQSEADNTGWRGTNEGGKLKETGTSHWMASNSGATNLSGFTALPGGYLGTMIFFYIKLEGTWWTSNNEYSYRQMSYAKSQVKIDDSHVYGSSVRCVRD